MMTELKIENMCFGYEDGPVLNKVNMLVEQGDFVGIIGSNGTGKSTLVKLILGQLSPKEGSIEADYKNIGYVPQTGLVVKADFPATVREIVTLNLYRQIGLFKRAGKIHQQRVDKALKTVGMLECADKQIGKLSGGQQQRVMIAKALVANPEILILDEPTTGVDAENEKLLYELLYKLNCEERLTIIMVTHSIESVEESMNKIFVIEDRMVSRRK
jgi:zinc transport system ATP-binding protein